MHLKEQFLNDLKDVDMLVEIKKALVSMLDTSSVTSSQVLAWAIKIAFLEDPNHNARHFKRNQRI